MSLPSRRASLFMSKSKSSNGSSFSKDSPVQTPGGDSKIFRDYRDQVKKGTSISYDIATMASVVDAIRHADAIDDRKLLLEHALTKVSRMDPGPKQQEIQNLIIKLLYNDLPHPPSTGVGDTNCWRTADGSCNNLEAPDVGKAHTPYARSVQPSHPLPYNQLPDPGLLFDTLLKREGFVKHPAGLSSLFFAFATLVIHTVFRTSHERDHINQTSSYVDLAPLYGHDQTHQNKIRIRDGYGVIYPDSFAEYRLLLLPPAVCTLLVLFSRNHNYIARKLYEINEKGTFKDPKHLKEDLKISQDEEIFQVARLINCGWFGSIVFSDYFSCILGLVRQGNSWSLNPFGEIRNLDHSIFERGKGNACSVEFNCLYRWHATISVEDEKWTDQVFGKLFPNKPISEVTVDDFKYVAKKAQQELPEAAEWAFGGLERQADGRFKDEDLARVLQNATEHPAGAFRARGTPPIMRLNEVMGIEQSRAWGVCSLNDFRKFLGLKTYKSFLEWNSNPEIAETAEKLYGDIERLELYVGLQAEEAKEIMDGAGLCPGYTISRAILSDAIALTRGDRFFTHDFSPQNLTAWGFADCQRDPNAFGFGSTLGRLILRTLPHDYTRNSVYAFFPMMVPGAMKTHLSNLNRLDDYDILRPKPDARSRFVSDYAQIGEILQNNEVFTSEYAARAARIHRGKGFYTVENEMEQEAVVHSLIATSGDEKALSLTNQVGDYFYNTTRKLVEEKSFTFVGGKVRGVDVAQHVAKLVSVYWTATEVAGIKLKISAQSEGKYTPLELYDMLAEIYDFIFLDVDKAKFVVLGQKATGHIHDLIPLIKSESGIQKSLIDKIGGTLRKSKTAGHSELIKRIQEISRSPDQLTITLLALMVSTTAELSLALTNMLNLYIGSNHGTDIATLATSSDVKDKLHGYVYEALRIAPPFRGVYRTCKENKQVLDFSAQANDRIFLDVYRANTNGNKFPDPHVVDPSRDSKTLFYPDGLHKTLGEPLTVKIMSEVLRAIFSLKNVRRAAGNSGQLQRFKDADHARLLYVYIGTGDVPTAWPTSWMIEYDV